MKESLQLIFVKWGFFGLGAYVLTALWFITGLVADVMVLGSVYLLYGVFVGSIIAVWSARKLLKSKSKVSLSQEEYKRLTSAVPLSQLVKPHGEHHVKLKPKDAYEEFLNTMGGEEQK